MIYIIHITYTFSVPKYPFIPFWSNEQQQKNVDLKLKSENYISTLNTNIIPENIGQELTWNQEERMNLCQKQYREGWLDMSLSVSVLLA